MSPRFVAEACSNHGGDLERCLAFVDAAADAGCAAVKFQQFRVRELFAPEALAAKPELLEREAWELPEVFNEPLAARARARGIAFASTPFYARAVDVLAPHVDFFKLASYQLLWSDMLAAVARTGKPVVLATGMATLDEVGEAVGTLRAAGCRDLTLLHCVSSYPTPPAEANLAAIETLRESFGTAVGWSDHTRDADVVERAVRRFGATMVEFHLDLEGRGAEYALGHCWLPGEIGPVVRGLERPLAGELARIHPADGDGRREPRPCEAVERTWRTDPADGLRPLQVVRAGLRRPAAA
jgi:N-acetylneuraminate synthase